MHRMLVSWGLWEYLTSYNRTLCKLSTNTIFIIKYKSKNKKKGESSSEKNFENAHRFCSHNRNALETDTIWGSIRILRIYNVKVEIPVSIGFTLLILN
ncbi:hypothetical protein COM13_28875 [Bacillus pseudomycoides]|nr:hypothetical protein COO07_28255 [Bacillus pseudomycoides]PEN00873.1 hypothetical protein CN640_29385 [Bacillus pseudomycoides]PGB76404.1 hypothetical protein COM13_28875 [Bacillus pseudomycoides]PHE52787.1 hypothetical protein COF52_28670 [Bacillus pseudomycoides]